MPRLDARSSGEDERMPVIRACSRHGGSQMQSRDCTLRRSDITFVTTEINMQMNAAGSNRGNRTIRSQAQELGAIVVVATVWGASASCLASELPKNSIITPKGVFSESYRTQFQDQSVPIAVEFEKDGKTARATYGSGGNGGPGRMVSWVVIVGGRKQVIKADWTIGDALRRGIDVSIACGPRASTLKIVKTLKSLAGLPKTPDEKEKLNESITPRTTDRVCKITLSFETYGHYDVSYRFATVELASK